MNTKQEGTAFTPMYQHKDSNVIPADCRNPDTMDGKAHKHVHVFWMSAQICLEQICINPKGIRQAG